MSTDVEIKQRDRILEAIDQLRRRKARPDSPRICNYMMRRFNVEYKETKADLQKCVEKEIVFKVEYKGDISYRNAAKWIQRHKSAPGGTISASDTGDHNRSLNCDKKMSGTFSKIVAHSISELICQEPDYLELGVPGPSLVKAVNTKSMIKYNKKHLMLLLQKEVESGGLIKLENGNFSLGQNCIDTDRSDDEYGDDIDFDQSMIMFSTSDKSLSPNISEENEMHTKIKKKSPKVSPKKFLNDEFEKEEKNNDKVGFRVGGRKKLAKKVFDPSDNNLPKRKRGRQMVLTKEKPFSTKYPSRPASVASNVSKSDSVVPLPICWVCRQTKKLYERMISCRDCTNKVHQTCLNMDDGMFRLSADNTWQCPRCKTCVACGDTLEVGPMLACVNCLDAFHNDCHIPKIENCRPSSNRWLCYNCENTPDPIKSNGNESSSVKKLKTDDYEVKIDISASNSDALSRSSESPPALSPQNRLDYSNGSSNEYKNNNSITVNRVNTVRDENNDSSKSYDDENLDSDDNYDPNIPDATAWTFEDVYQYFNQYFPSEALVFRTQEIDGHSLLLMKRNDVLNNLNLKLGPALKIYRHVLKLQVRREDPKLGWF